MFKGSKKRRLAVALGVCMMAPSVAVHALGMGEIEVHSALNEPLKAQIKLLSVTAGELSALQVALASNEAFSRMGIDPAPALRNLRFEVVTQGAGAPYISVVSDVPIREPFLDLILMANWSNGQLMREYTLLLDPPVFDKGESVAPVMAAKTESAAIDRSQKSAAVAVPAAAPVSRAAPAGSYGPTSRTDTLWRVARDMRPNSSVSVPQMMIALLKENPEAFVDGNVNNLKAGYILRSPSMDVINSVSSTQAVADTNRHYQEWQAAGGKSSVINRRQRLATTAPETAAGQPAKPAAAAATVESSAHLKLLSPEDAKQQGGVGSSVKGKGSTTEQLAMALETAEATKQENAELKARLTDLERQLQAVQRLLTLKGDTLGALQAGLGEKESASQQPAPVAAGATAPAGEQAGQTAEVAGATATAPKEKPVAEAAKPKPAPVVQPEPIAGPSLLDEVMANPVLLASAVGGPLLLLLVAALIRRRRQQAELEEIGGLTAAAEHMQDESEPMAAMAAGVAAKSAVAEEDTFGGAVEESVADYGAASSGMGAIQAEENEIDPIAEADVYLAYRRYEQAEALLKEAIRHDSNRNELKLKLLEIYFTTKDKDAFEAQAEGLYASLGGQEDELWAQAVEMGREISPEHPLFAEAGGLHPSLGAGTVAAAAATVGGAAVVADKESIFDKSPSDFGDEFSFDLSDEELANSLNMPSLEEGEVGVGGDLEELSEVDEFSLDDDLSAISEGEELDLGALDKLDDSEAVADEEFNLDDDLIGGDGLGDFDSELDDLTEGVDLDELGSLEKEDSGATQNITHSSDDSDKWTIAPAVSSFNSREVKSETDSGYVPVTNVVKDVASGHDLEHLSLDEAELDLGDSESNIFDGSDDIIGTKLDLARAYIDMGDQSGARSILDEIVKEGDDSHRQEAEQLMRQIS